ncbi:MAG: hypothetical protein ABSC62_09245 [Terracidiphilus sp.]|jgi:hypothetical protein
MTNEREARQKGIPWRDNSSFVSTYYSILAAMAGAILALAVGDQEIKASWYLPVGLLAFSMICFIWGHEKCADALDEDDVDKYLAWLLAYNFGTAAMFFGIATYIGFHYRLPWTVFVAILILAVAASWKWLHDIGYLLFKGEVEYEAYREELLGLRQLEKEPDWLMCIHRFFRLLRKGKAEK